MTELPFSQSYQVSSTEAEIRAWLKTNRQTLAGRDATEVAHLAVTCGFDIADVCATLSTFRDAMDGSHIGNRAAVQTWLFEMAAEDCGKLRKNLEPRELDLMPLWQDVHTYQTGMAA